MYNSNYLGDEGGSKPPAKRARGRPQRIPEGSTIDKEKRARGREVQRAFQQRRQAEVNHLQQRVAALEGTIEGMSNEFLGFGDRVVADAAAIGNQRALYDVRRTTKRFLELATQAEELGDEEVFGQSSSSRLGLQKAPNSVAKYPSLAPVPFSFTSLFQAGIPNLDIFRSYNSASRPPQLEPISAPVMGGVLGGGNFSPRLGYGLLDHDWLPAPVSPWDNPWLSYLIAGPNSFASRLYIDAIDMILKALRSEVNIPGFIPRILRYRFRHQNAEALASSLSLQLQRMNISGHNGGETVSMVEMTDYRALTPNEPGATFSTASGLIEQGSTELMSMQLNGWDEDGNPLLIFQPMDYAKLNEALKDLLVYIIRDVEAEGGRPGECLDPWSVQEHISREWGLRLGTRTVRPSNRTAIMFRGTQTKTGRRIQLAPVENSNWPSPSNLFPTLDENIPAVPLMPPIFPTPSLTLYDRDPTFGQRYTYTRTMASETPASYRFSAAATLPSVMTINKQSTQSESPSKNPMLNLNLSKDSSSAISASPLNFPSQDSALVSLSTIERSSFKNDMISNSIWSGDSELGVPMSTLPEVLPVTPLVTALILGSTCFGEGPRFQRPVVDQNVRAFLESHWVT